MRNRALCLMLASAIGLSACSSTPKQMSREGFPAHWWKSYSKASAPAWEILPDQAGPGEVILSKRNELGLMSNFSATPFEYHGKHYNSIEGFWQMMLYPEGPNDPRAKAKDLVWAYTREEVSQMVAFEAKKAGELASKNMEKLGIDWVTFEGKRITYRPSGSPEHTKLITEVTWAKVNQNPAVKELLLSTGDLVLKPDHHQRENPPESWKYYEIYMKIRDELRKSGE
jgi:predicted NAD-dependent protein-ADP-ribosyltransferase YbiA (DUF1768 family)